MTALRLALTELRRIGASRVGRLALVAMVLVPSIYGGLYLYANNDPYGGLNRVPAALVVEDTGTTLSTGERLEVGDQVVETLMEKNTFDWARVDRATADAGLEAGDYDLVLVVPASFSKDLASSATNDPRQATLQIRTNDANNYLARTIANTLVSQVTASVAEQVSSTAASRFLEGFADIHAQVTDAAHGAARLADGAGTAAKGAGDLADGADQLVAGEKKLVTGTDELSSGAGDLADGLGTLRDATADLPAQTEQLADGARQVSDGNAKVAAAGRDVADAADTLLGDLTASRGRLADELRAAGFTQAQVDTVLARVDGLSGPLDRRQRHGAVDLRRPRHGWPPAPTGSPTVPSSSPRRRPGSPVASPRRRPAAPPWPRVPSGSPPASAPPSTARPSSRRVRTTSTTASARSPVARRSSPTGSRRVRPASPTRRPHNARRWRRPSAARSRSTETPRRRPRATAPGWHRSS